MEDTKLIYKGQQSLIGNLTDYAQGTPVRAVVHRDAYDSQSYGIAQMWTANGWADIQLFPIHLLAVGEKSYVSKDGEWESAMEDDLIALIAYAYNHLLHAGKW